MDDVIVRMRHLRACGFCIVPGVRDWCKQHEIDFKKFVKEGMPASELEKLNDLFANRAVEQARKDQQ